MRIAVDAMGGDHSPAAPVEGALLAAESYPDVHLVLCGQEEQIAASLDRTVSNIDIVHTDEIITADDDPVRSVRRKKNSSLVKVTQMVHDQEVDACISAGNTGAYMSAGLFVTGRMPGIERPALTTIMPTITGHPVLVLDVGANVDAKPEHLVQYARLGKLYAQKMLHVDQPSIGLLNIGTENNKGNELMKATFPLLKNADPHFTGNIEARDVTRGICDVVVCDGFSGNVVLKSTEGVAEAVFSMLKEEFTRNIFSKLAALALKPGLKRIKSKMDYTEYGGAPLLGLNGVCIKAHGSSNAKAIFNAVKQARQFVQSDVLSLMKSEVKKESDAL